MLNTEFTYSYFARSNRLFDVTARYALHCPGITRTGTEASHPMQVNLTGTSVALNAPLAGPVEQTHTLILFNFHSLYYEIIFSQLYDQEWILRK